MFRRWAIFAATLLATSWIVPGFQLHGIWNAIVVAAVFGVLNALIGWLVAGLFIVGTLGLGLLFRFVTHWVTNAVLLVITQSFTHRLWVSSFGTALIASAVMSGVGAILDSVLTDDRRR